MPENFALIALLGESAEPADGFAFLCHFERTGGVVIHLKNLHAPHGQCTRALLYPKTGRVIRCTTSVSRTIATPKCMMCIVVFR